MAKSTLQSVTCPACDHECKPQGFCGHFTKGNIHGWPNLDAAPMATALVAALKAGDEAATERAREAIRLYHEKHEAGQTGDTPAEQPPTPPAVPEDPAPAEATASLDADPGDGPDAGQPPGLSAVTHPEPDAGDLDDAPPEIVEAANTVEDLPPGTEIDDWSQPDTEPARIETTGQRPPVPALKDAEPEPEPADGETTRKPWDLIDTCYAAALAILATLAAILYFRKGSPDGPRATGVPAGPSEVGRETAGSPSDPRGRHERHEYGSAGGNNGQGAPEAAGQPTGHPGG